MLLLPDLPDATRDAVDQAAGVLRRSRAALTAAILFADRARQRLSDADTRADLLQARMADVKYARRGLA
jgi:hypothetical protein